MKSGVQWWMQYCTFASTWVRTLNVKDKLMTAVRLHNSLHCLHMNANWKKNINRKNGNYCPGG